MSINWPSVLPVPSLKRYSGRIGEAVARTNMEQGAARQRQRFLSSPSKSDLRWIMNQEQFALFQYWYVNQAKEGAEWVNIDLKVGIGYISHETRFLEPYKYKLLSDDLFEVTAQIEVRIDRLITSGVYDLLLAGYTEGIITSMADLLHTMVHTTLPMELGTEG